jgi:polar amino acid transport system substrate-binding protein
VVDAQMAFVEYDNIVLRQAASRVGDELTIQYPADLSTMTVIAFQGASQALGADFQDAVKQNTAYQETVDQQAQVDMLLHGRANAIVLDRNIFTYHQQNLPELPAVTMHELFTSTLYRTTDCRSVFCPITPHSCHVQ